MTHSRKRPHKRSNRAWALLMVSVFLTVFVIRLEPAPAEPAPAEPAPAEPAPAGILNDSTATTHPAHERLRAAVARYQRIAEKGGWPTIPPGDLLEKGDTSKIVIPLRERLAVTGDPPPDTEELTAYDEGVADAVTAFQRRHDLTVDGILGPETRGALNVSVRERIQQMERNLQRWESLPNDLGKRYVLVNIPEYRVRAYRQDEVEHSMRIIVGAEFDGRATPLFSEQMEYVVFRPYWNIPASIANEEILPDARGNRSYLARNGYQVVSHYALMRRFTIPVPSISTVLPQVSCGCARSRARTMPSASSNSCFPTITPSISTAPLRIICLRRTSGRSATAASASSDLAILPRSC